MERKEIEVKYLATDVMTADILTKPFTGKKFIEMRTMLMGM